MIYYEFLWNIEMEEMKLNGVLKKAIEMEQAKKVVNNSKTVRKDYTI